MIIGNIISAFNATFVACHPGPYSMIVSPGDLVVGDKSEFLVDNGLPNLNEGTCVWREGFLEWHVDTRLNLDFFTISPGFVRYTEDAGDYLVYYHFSDDWN